MSERLHFPQQCCLTYRKCSYLDQSGAALLDFDLRLNPSALVEVLPFLPLLLGVARADERV